MSARVRQVYDCPYDILYRVLTPDHNRPYVACKSLSVPCLSIARHVSQSES